MTKILLPGLLNLKLEPLQYNLLVVSMKLWLNEKHLFSFLTFLYVVQLLLHAVSLLDILFCKLNVSLNLVALVL